MTHYDIHEIIEQIAHTLDCPQCRTRILPHNIVITGIMGSDCTFDAKCERCETEMTLSAHIEKTTVDEARTHNRSSQIMHDGFAEEPINIEDVQQMRVELKNFCGSFIETFCR
jgi:hypothetical protein